VAPFSGQYSDADPFITTDGQRFFFISTRPVDGKRKEDNDIWMMEKKGAGWGVPQCCRWTRGRIGRFRFVFKLAQGRHVDAAP
jgi:hypothetical protein